MSEKRIDDGVRIYYVRDGEKNIVGTVAVEAGASAVRDAEGRPDRINRAIAVASLKDSGCKRVGRGIVLERLSGLRRSGRKTLGALPANKAGLRFATTGRGLQLPTPLYMAEAGVRPNDFESYVLRKDPNQTLNMEDNNNG